MYVKKNCRIIVDTTNLRHSELASTGGQVNSAKLWWYGPEWLSNTELWPEDMVAEPIPESNAVKPKQ